MKLSRPSRFVAALIALISVLFTQLAVAAYACPGMQAAQTATQATAAAAGEGHRMMPDCGEMDVEQPVLCDAHAQAGNQSLDKPEIPNVSPPMAILLVPAGRDIEFARPATAYAGTASLRRASAPPLSIQHCCFRI